MSNPQDLPLANPQEMPLANPQDTPLANPEGPALVASEETQEPSTSSLKRFFKIITFSRFFSRKKAPNTDAQQQSSSVADPTEQGRSEEMHEMQVLQNDRTADLEVTPPNPTQQPQAQTIH